MKNLFSLLFVLLSITYSFAQNGFEKKKKVSTGSQVKETFNTISGKQFSSNTYARFVDSPSDYIKKIIKDEENYTVIYAKNPAFSREEKKARRSFQNQGIAFIKSLKDELIINEPEQEFNEIEQNTDELGINHIKLAQKFKGIKIYGGEVWLHSDKNGIVDFLNGRLYPTPQINVMPNFSAQEAINKAYNDLSQNTIIQKEGLVNKLLSIEKDQSELTILNEGGQTFLAYHLSVRPNLLERWVYFIDAHTGKIIDKYNHTCTLDGVVQASAKDLNGITRSFNVLQLDQTYYMIDPSKPMFKNNQSRLPDEPVGTIWTIDGQNSRIDAKEMNLSHVVSIIRNNWTATSVSAQTNASTCFDYFYKTFGRNSLNGSGGNIISVINIADEDGEGMDNAYWNGQFMGYGNGRNAFKPLAGALDVAGHEMTHGVIENTAKLEYRNQSGALNESFADIFGALIDRDDWLLGEDVVKTSAFPSGALRSLENPNQGGKNDPGYQPKTMSQYAYLRDTPSEDNGGVHVNSGIPNHAFYRFATGSGMNKDKAEKVYYRALTTYLTRTSKFTDLRLAVVQATKDLYGSGQELAAANAAFDAVGITDPNATGTGGTGGNTTPGNTSDQSTLPVNPGTEQLVVFDPNNQDQSLYTTDVAGNNIKKITQNLGCQGKPSVTDDGTFVYFVGKDNHIYRYDLSKTSGDPQKLSNSPDWRNVAISKDGKLLAALSGDLDPYIYVFDLVNNKQSRFELYNPTYTQGVSTGEVLYADSFEWDYTGEFIIYDAFNQAKSNFRNIEFWDVGIIKVWDAIGKKFADGVIEKMFTNLEEGDNIGNPTLAKTNTGIFAFDYFNDAEEAYYIVTIDFGKSTDNIKAIENNEIGYPDFNKTDKMIIYNSLNGQTPVVKTINLASDKITATGNPQTRFLDAKWGVWYALGQRALPTKEAQVITFSSITDKQPGTTFDIVASSDSNLGLIFTVISGDASINGRRITLGNIPGKITIRAIQDGNSKYAPATADATFCIIPPTPTLTQNQQNVIASGGTQYQFYVNNNPIGGFTTNASLKKDFNGNYTVRAVTADGCLSALSNSINVTNQIVLANENRDFDQVLVAPNPIHSTAKIIIKNNEILDEIKVYDLVGNLILKTKNQVIDLQSIPSGQYILNVKTNKETYQIKSVKN